MVKKSSVSKTRISSLAGKKGTFQFRWWMALLFIAIVAVIGIVVLRLSYASADRRITNTYSTFSWPQHAKSYTDLEWTVTPISDPSPQGIYWATDFTFLNSGNKPGDGNAPGYAGLQTKFGASKVALFSIWGALGADGPGIHRAFGNEGSGYQTIINYDWQVNRAYRFRIVQEGSNTVGTIWSGYITDVTSGTKQKIGSIFVPSKWGGFNSSTGSWTEYFGGSITSNCSSIPYIAAKFTDFRFNNGTISPLSHTNSYEAGQNCPEASRVTDIVGGVIQEIGVAKPTPNISTSKSLTINVAESPTGVTVKNIPVTPEQNPYSQIVADTQKPILRSSACVTNTRYKGTDLKSCVVDAPTNYLQVRLVAPITQLTQSRQVRICLSGRKPTNSNSITMNLNSGTGATTQSTPLTLKFDYPGNKYPLINACANNNQPITVKDFTGLINTDQTIVQSSVRTIDLYANSLFQVYSITIAPVQ